MLSPSLCLLFVAAIVPLAYPARAGNFDARPAQGVLARLLPHQARQFDLRTLAAAPDGRERFRISSGGDPRLAAAFYRHQRELFGDSTKRQVIRMRSQRR
ncbi:MAG: hypothetical protein KGO22_15445 [Gammaproteobacteria bacterium]|nr:hypothetical protein [Gammaproteobacteria bacterium]